VLFSDIRNFTSISEKYEPEEITAMLNFYFGKWAQAAKEHEGIIDKYIGDAVMIVFKDEKNKAVTNALNCALKLLNERESIKFELADRKLPVFDDIGIGINFGTVIAGDIGGAERVDYTYIGDTVNIASRLESMCKEFNRHLIISSDSYDLLSEGNKKLFSKSYRTIQLKGKNQNTDIYLFNEESVK
jgi:adenylate cyclase